MNTLLLYEEDSKLCEFEAQVLECEKKEEYYQVVLDQTAFYPEGGGQPPDFGTLGEAKVWDVQEKDGIVYHTVDTCLQKGTKVTGSVDWSRRFDFMQNHTGEHILSGLIYRNHGLHNVGFHMGSDVITLDVDGKLTEDQIHAIEYEGNQAVFQNLAVSITYPTEAELSQMDYRSKKKLTGRVRIVEIPGFDLCACCGTHVSHTGEIGLIKILGFQNYKGGVRISIVCGKRALAEFEKKCKQTAAISNLLSASQDDLSTAVEKLKKEKEQWKSRADGAMEELFRRKAASLDPEMQSVLVLERNLNANQLKNYANTLLAGRNGVVAILSTEETGCRYLLASQAQDVRPLSKELNQVFHGKGGGAAQMVQGSIDGKAEDCVTWFQSKDISLVSFRD